MTRITGDTQYTDFAAEMRKRKPISLGLMTGWVWYDDPRRLAFTLARYKFIAKMLDGCGDVLEIGCGDGFGTRIVAQAVQSVIGIDIQPDFIVSANEHHCEKFRISFLVHDIVKEPMKKRFKAGYCLDVLEHIDPGKEDLFLSNIAKSLQRECVFIIGAPSQESQIHASLYSRMGHVNCKTQQDLKALMQKYFKNTFMFSMNDEIVHTGFSKMSHYNIALCCGNKVAGKKSDGP